MKPPNIPSIFDRLPAPAPRYLMRLALLNDLIELLPRPVENFLEVGPGMGDVSLYLARRFPSARGKLMDVSSDCIGMLHKLLATEPRLIAEHGDFQKLGQSAVYDLVVACEVFEHLEDDESAFSAVARLLRPGGSFLFSAPAFMSKWQNSDEYAGHYRRYERDEIVEKFRRHHFSIERLWCFGFPITEIMYPLRQYYYRPRSNQRPIDKSSATQRSGIERTLVRRFRWLPWAKLLWPFFECQSLVKNRNIGDGYVVLARKL